MPKRIIKVCHGQKCTERGSKRILEKLKQDHGGNPDVEIEFCVCRGYCEQAPNVYADNKIFHGTKTSTITKQIEQGNGVEDKKITEKDLHLDDIL